MFYGFLIPWLFRVQICFVDFDCMHGYLIAEDFDSRLYGLFCGFWIPKILWVLILGFFCWLCGFMEANQRICASELLCILLVQNML